MCPSKSMSSSGGSMDVTGDKVRLRSYAARSQSRRCWKVGRRRPMPTVLDSMESQEVCVICPCTSATATNCTQAADEFQSIQS